MTFVIVARAVATATVGLVPTHNDRHRLPTHGAGVSATWIYTLGSLVFFYVLLYFLIIMQALGSLQNTGAVIDAVLLGVLVIAAVVQIRFCWLLREGSEYRLLPRSWVIGLFVSALAAWVFAFLVPNAWIYAVAPVWLAAALIVCVVPRGRRLFVLVPAAALVAVPVLVQCGDSSFAQLAEANNPGFWMLAIYSALMPAMTLTSLWGWRVVKRLDESRAVAAQLAVAQERLRFAADLHDIQGHHLQVIALKSELAERLLTVNPEAAGEQVGEIRLIAKEALEETRALVAGMREVSLEDELENAREVLTLAGATCGLAVSASPRDAEARRVFALAVREATTNILRHSEADTAQIELSNTRGGVQLRVTNNGAGAASGAAAGSGLRGARERIEALRGTLRVTHESGSFMIEAWVPEAHGEA